MEERIYDYWVATLQDGYMGNLVNIVKNAGGARALYGLSRSELVRRCRISDKLAGYIEDHRPDIRSLEEEYYRMQEDGVTYVNHSDPDFPEKLKNIPGSPYGIFVKGHIPDPQVPSVAIVGARECSEYGRIMAEFFASRLAKEGVQVISGMAAGIDGIAQSAALNSGGKSYAVLGCGVDIIYPARNRDLYRKLCNNGNGLISEYAPGTPAVARLFPPRNRIISGLCDVLIVVEARAKSGTLITVDMAIEQGRTVMVVPGRLTDNLSAGCLNLLYQGALPATGIEAVLEQLGVNRQMGFSDLSTPSPVKDDKIVPAELTCVLDVMNIEPQSIGQIAESAKIMPEQTMIILTRLEMEGLVREVYPGYYIRKLELV
ncbi:MAG: DNA-processing protein DprA [Lachnospiraceae bacterium]|nr:DNA-processing protein DprA [Lachnospiraceae bacterium]